MIISIVAQAAQAPSLIQFEMAEETALGSGLPGLFSGVGAVAGVLNQPVELTVDWPYTDKALFFRAYLQVEGLPDSDYSDTVQYTLQPGIPVNSTLFDPIDVNGAVSQLIYSGTAVSFLFTDPGTGADSPAGAPPLPAIPTIHSGSLTHVLEIRDYAKPADFRWFEWQYDHTTGGWSTLAKTTSTNLVHTKLDPALTYRYRVKAVDRAGNESSFATTSNATAVASSVRPDQIIAEQITAGSIIAGKIAAGSITATELAAGSVTASKISVTELSAISANLGIITAGKIQNAGDTAGVLVTGSLPGGWTRYLDLTADGGDTFLHHDKLDLKYDGTAEFHGQVDITAPLYGPSSLIHVLLRDPDIAHGITNVVPTDVLGYLGAMNGTTGGMEVFGLCDAGNEGMRVAAVNSGSSSVTPVMLFNVHKKNGVAVGALASSDLAFRFGTTGVIFLEMFGDKRFALQGQGYSTQFNNGDKSSAFDLDWNNGNSQRVRLTGSMTVTLKNGQAGGCYTIEVVQDGTGSRTITWAAEGGAAVIWAGGSAPTLTTTANRADLITFYKDDVPSTKKYMGLVNGKDFAV